MDNLEIIRGKNIFLSKEYLQRFYTDHKPKWVRFCENLLNEGYTVLLYLAVNTESKYLTLIKNNKMLKIRYSEHSPKLDNYIRGDIKFYIGPGDKGMYSEREVLNATRIYFRK